MLQATGKKGRAVSLLTSERIVRLHELRRAGVTNVIAWRWAEDDGLVCQPKMPADQKARMLPTMLDRAGTAPYLSSHAHSYFSKVT